MNQQSLEKEGKDVYENGRQALKQGLQSAKDLAESASDKSREVMERASERSREVMERSKDALFKTEDWAKENPWVTVGIIAGVGVLVGMLIGRNRD